MPEPPDSFSGVSGGAGIGRCCSRSWDGIKGHTSEINVVDLDGKVTTLYRGMGSFMPQDSLADGRLLVVQLKGTV
jgi:hypothetical protein